MTFALYSPAMVSMSRYTKAHHRIFMQFVRRDVWHVTFLEPGLRTKKERTPEADTSLHSSNLPSSNLHAR
jgi:hypothetical protein